MFEQPDTPPEQTPRQIADAKMIERRIEDAVYTRMRDPEYVIDALSVLITDNLMTQNTLANLVMGYGDMAVHVGNLRCDVGAHLMDQARKDAERGGEVMSEDKGRPVKPHRSGGGLPLPRELPPLLNYLQCVKCGGTHPSYHSCLGSQEPPRPAWHNPKA